MKTTDRRGFLQAGVGALALPLLGSLAGCETNPRKWALSTEKLTERVTLITGAPGNVIALAANDGVVLVDSGAANSAAAVKASLAGAKVRTLFNTHYHA